MPTVIVTFFGVGFFPFAQGTAGSLAAVLAALLLNEWYAGLSIFLVAILVVLAIGFWGVSRYIVDGDDRDPPEIVIDEVLGQWIALLPFSYLFHTGGRIWTLELGVLVVTSFLLFRILDIWKPGFIGWSERISGAAGVLLDDVAAGVSVVVLVSTAYAAIEILVP